MKKSLLLFAFLCLTLVAFPAVADDPKPEETPVEQAPAEPAAEEVTPASEESLDFLPGASLLTPEPQPVASCVPFACRQGCRSECAAGCFCVGSCVNGECECEEICM